MTIQSISIGGGDDGFLQQEDVKSIRNEKLVHKLFHGCNM